LNNHVFFWVFNGRPDFVGGVVCSQGTGRAAIYALAAVNADYFPERHARESVDIEIGAAINRFENANFLKVDAGSNAAAALNALVHVAHDAVA
jgi:hypothetical protein